MKKVFYPNGFRFWCAIATVSTIMLISVIFAIYGVITEGLGFLIFEFLLLAILTYPLIQTATYNIVLTDEEIYTRGEFGWGKTQYPVRVKYSDIDHLALAYSRKNSLGKKMILSESPRSTPILYLKIYTKKRKKRTNINIMIELFSEKQKKQIIEFINSKANLNDTYEMLAKR